jgi:hypothetical protein
MLPPLAVTYLGSGVPEKLSTGLIALSSIILVTGVADTLGGAPASAVAAATGKIAPIKKLWLLHVEVSAPAPRWAASG